MKFSPEYLPLDFSKSPIVTVRTGTDKEPFFIHSNLICRESKYFEACLKPNIFRESQTREVTLADIDPKYFKTIVKYCYTGTIADLVFHSLIRAYTVADKLLMNKCKNAIMDECRGRFSKEPIFCTNMGDLKLVQELEMPPQLPMRKFIIDKLAFDLYKMPNCFNNEAEIRESYALHDLNTLKDSELLRDLLVKVLSILHVADPGERNKEKWDPRQLKGCVYHDHEEGEKCSMAVETGG